MKINYKLNNIFILFIIFLLNLFIIYLSFRLINKKSNINFLNKEKAYNELFINKTEEGFLKDDNLFQLTLKLKNVNSEIITEINRENIIKNVFKKNILEFTNNDKYLINLYIKQIPYNWNWNFIKISDELANNLPYTRNNSIILYPKFIDSLNSFEINKDYLETLIHERIHIFQRYNKSLFERIYNKLGFYKIDNNIIKEINKNNLIVSNPDGLDYWKIKINEEYIIPILINSSNNKFANLSYKYYKLNNLNNLYDLNILKEYKNKLFCQENIDNIYHPNEISADLLSLYILQKIFNKKINICIKENYKEIIDFLNL